MPRFGTKELSKRAILPTSALIDWQVAWVGRRIEEDIVGRMGSAWIIMRNNKQEYWELSLTNPIHQLPKKSFSGAFIFQVTFPSASFWNKSFTMSSTTACCPKAASLSDWMGPSIEFQKWYTVMRRNPWAYRENCSTNGSPLNWKIPFCSPWLLILEDKFFLVTLSLFNLNCDKIGVSSIKGVYPLKKLSVLLCQGMPSRKGFPS